MQSEISPPNPNPNRPKLAFHFLRALAGINRSRSQLYSPSWRSNFRCGRRIKLAAYTSMALAAGPGRAWSRTILRRLRRRAPANPGRRGTVGLKVRMVQPRAREEGNQADELRRLVPGGRKMDFCSLLEETGDYIQCLTSQVQLMQRLADSMSRQASEFPKVEKDDTGRCQ